MTEPETDDDPVFGEAVARIAGKISGIAQGESVAAVQVALANVVTRLAIGQGAAACDRTFLETIDNMFEIYRRASNHKLRSEDQGVS